MRFARRWLCYPILLPLPSCAANPRLRTASTKSYLGPMLRDISIEDRDKFLGCWGHGDSAGKNDIPHGNLTTVQTAVVAVVRTDRGTVERGSSKHATRS